MVTPFIGNRQPIERVWAADTGCFNQPHKHNDETYLAWLPGKADPGKCLFATAPDVVGDAVATIARSMGMLARIRGVGFAAALVGQDGLEGLSVPWDAFDCLFLGGTTAWKLSLAAERLSYEAKARGKWLHMGRVNSFRRVKIAKRFGCDSVDGTYVAFAPDLLGPRAGRWMRTIAGQQVLPLGV